ncbi:MAG TPA: molybdenum cofactor guanylyltransferase MobA [Rhodocyclaceae bacterium]
MQPKANDRITGLVLAGGLGRRMGGVDKGLQLLNGRPMVAWVLERLERQVGRVMINANQNAEVYRGFGHDVIADRVGGFAGPLAGLHSGLSACKTDLLASAPCDSPFLPLDLVAQLHRGLEREGAEVAVARSDGKLQSVFLLARCTVLNSLETFLASGGRKIDAWFASLTVATVEFPEVEGFANINTREELAAAALSPEPGRS